MSARHKCARSRIVILLAAATVGMFPVTAASAEFLQLPEGSEVDLSWKCPVCGMVVGGKDGRPVTVSYKDGRVVGFAGVAAAVLKDGHVVGFEGARCLFIYNSVPEKYDINVADIAHQYVTDFVSKKMFELPKAFLVLGSNVKGPMGYDLIPFTTREEAAKFARENDGKWIVQLHEIARKGEEARAEPSAAAKESEPQKEEAPALETRPAKTRGTIQEAPDQTVVPRGSGHRGMRHGH